ncbi:type II toxin-antitoxin system HicA family toxin [Leptolyngbya sp. FACHB-36]|uniref:type II toxin-antitoxin system HicA family toxin n=1 Tax=Leptolyngbya sp. FACHB-36 TaxID=2692808 RepID=UPI00168121F4|nr:type II toxin-antitoxin system HicA family toxin [Leptolyngbya sp. FACHB-36]MBD2018776.1 type II toxin-antitoxin system HicA family toxin [Leptolyngbya sp. FACHB-36]
MPKKVRELKQAIAKAGYTLLKKRGKGSHTFWVHSSLPEDPLVIPGNDGEDAPRYLEKEVERVLQKLADLEKE